ncbi:MAG: response regulator [Candidatus Rokubacteria bacterium]|nr:response regulator [Candidatus Rokubacteria bacterium]
MAEGRILVVDDEESIAESFRVVLQEQGYTVRTAGSASHALAEVERADWDLAFVDLLLPDMDGLELLKKLKARRPGLLAVVITAHGAGAKGFAAREAGAYAFLEKPEDVTPGKILNVATNALEHKSLLEKVRELEHAIERSVLVARGSEVTVADLPEVVTRARAVGAPAPEAPAAAATLNLEERERQAILQALETTNWNKQAAAALLGLHRPTLYSKMRKHGIPQKRP